MPRILVINEICWPEGSGAELATHLILGLLESEKNDITVLTGTKVPSRTKKIKYVYSSQLAATNKIELWKNFTTLSQKNCFVKLLKQTDILYITHLAYPVIPLAKKLGKKVIVHLHNYQPISYNATVDYPYEKKYSHKLLDQIKSSIRYGLRENEGAYKTVLGAIATPLNRLSEKWISQADNVLCVSKRQAMIMTNTIPEIAKKIRVLYNPLPKVPYVKRKIENNSIFLYVGGDSAVKGIDVLFQASLKLLQNKKTKFILTKIESKKWRNESKRLNTISGNAYSIFRKLPKRKFTRLFMNCAAIVIPSTWEEPLPYALSESMLRGTLPLASRAGGIPELVKGTFAEKTLFTPGNVKELVDRMEYVLSLSNEQLIDIGWNLRRQTLERFKDTEIKKDLLKIFDA